MQLLLDPFRRMLQENGVQMFLKRQDSDTLRRSDKRVFPSNLYVSEMGNTRRLLYI